MAFYAGSFHHGAVITVTGDISYLHTRTPRTGIIHSGPSEGAADWKRTCPKPNGRRGDDFSVDS